MEEGLIKKLMTSMKCSSCGQYYEGHDIEVVGHHEDLWFLRALCSTCHTLCLVAAVIKEGRMLQAVTDLTEAEADKFRDIGAPEANDVLNMHSFLEDFAGDFSHLFGQK